MKRRAGMIMASTALLFSTGCLIWPFPTGHLLSGRGRIQPEYTAPLAVGKATREDVLLRLGEPDVVLDNGAVYLYRWTEARGFFALFGQSSSIVIPFPGHRGLRLEFDAESRLRGVIFGLPGGPEADPEKSPPPESP